MSSQEDRIRNEFKSPFNFMSLKELQIKFPNLNWKNYINEMLAPHLQIDFSENIVVIEKSYVKSFFDLISKTPKRVLANYLFWRVVKNSASSLGEQVREAEREFSVKFPIINFGFVFLKKNLVEMVNLNKATFKF